MHVRVFTEKGIMYMKLPFRISYEKVEVNKICLLKKKELRESLLSFETEGTMTCLKNAWFVFL